MNAQPMMLNTQMINALIAGKKTTIRHPVPEWQLPSLTHDGERYICVAQRHPRWGFGFFGKTPDEAIQQLSKGSLCPLGHRNDYLYARETLVVDEQRKLSYLSDGMPVDGRPEGWFYRNPEYVGKIPSIHAPKWSNRLTLKITSARVEKVKDITPEQALAEGFASRMEFAKSWNSLYKNWNSNPYVWAISFEVIYSNIETAIANQKESKSLKDFAFTR